MERRRYKVRGYIQMYVHHPDMARLENQGRPRRLSMHTQTKDKLPGPTLSLRSMHTLILTLQLQAQCSHDGDSGYSLKVSENELRENE